MRRLIWLLLLLTVPAEGAEVARAGQYELHSSFWQSLHQTLLSARRWDKLEDGWQQPVEAYRKAYGRRDAVSSDDIVKVNNALMSVADDADVRGVPDDIAAALRAAAPLYRQKYWPRDDRANRFWIAYAAPMLREGAPEISAELSRLWERPWPDGPIRIDVTPFAGANGAYTTSRPSHIIVSTTDPAYVGINALEMMLHESSHLIVGPNGPALGSPIADAAKKLGVPYPDGLWHALLFRTAGEVTRRWLAQRNVDYKTIADQVINVAWPQFKTPLDTHWKAFLQGKMTRDAAIEAIVKDSAAAPK